MSIVVKKNLAYCLSIVALFLSVTMLRAESNYDLADGYYAKQVSSQSLQSYAVSWQPKLYADWLAAGKKFDGVSDYFCTDGCFGGDGDMGSLDLSHHEEFAFALKEYYYGEGWLRPVHRFYSPITKSHFFTMNEGEKKNLLRQSSTWNYEGIAYYAYEKQAYSTVPLYRFYSLPNKAHFYTINEAEKNTLLRNRNWRFEGVAYYVDDEKISYYDTGSKMYNMRDRVNVHRFWSNVYRHHFYTTSEGEKNKLQKDKNWQYDGIVYSAVPTEYMTKPRSHYIYVSPSIKCNYCEESWSCQHTIEYWESGLDFTVIATEGQAYPKITPPVLPGYVFDGFYNTYGGETYYGIDGKSVKDIVERDDFDFEDERNTYLKARFIFEGPSSIVKTTPIYRLYSTKTGRHFYTKDLNEKNTLVSRGEWRYENVAYNAFLNFTIGSVPLYRFYSLPNKAHFYTTNEKEKEMLLWNQNWRFEGIAYYVETTSQYGGKPVYRFYSNTTKAHFFTASEGEKNVLLGNKNWRFEGIAFYAPNRNRLLSLTSNSTSFELADWTLSHSGVSIDTIGEITCEGFTLVTSEIAPSDEALLQKGDLLQEGLLFTLKIPEGNYVATLWNVADNEYIEEEATEGEFDLALSKINTWYRLEVKDLDGEIVYSLWLMVK